MVYIIISQAVRYYASENMPGLTGLNTERFLNRKQWLIATTVSLLCCRKKSKTYCVKMGRYVCARDPMDPPAMYTAFQVQVKAGRHNYYVKI